MDLLLVQEEDDELGLDLVSELLHFSVVDFVESVQIVVVVYRVERVH